MFSKLPHFYMFLMIMFVGTLLSVSSVYWLGIWVGLEINLIGFLPLMVYKKSIMESESAVKYFVVQAIGSGLLLFGSLLSYNLSLSWDLIVMNWDFVSLDFFCLYYMSILIMGLCLKLGIFPFHFWLPSVMGGLSWFSCLLLATWQKIAPLFLMVFLIQNVVYYNLILIMCFMASGSSLIGGLGGYNQSQIRALLAYSSISHLGWIFFSCIYSETVMVIYLAIYIMITFGLFLSLLHSNLFIMKVSKKMLDSMVSAKITMMVLFLTLGGLPPFLGFFSKWLVMYVSLTVETFSFSLFFLILGNLISLSYYLSLSFNIYLSELKKYQIGKIYNMGLNMYMWIFVIVVNVVSLMLIMKLNLFSVFL
uniref:NADH-ubiquinone oxidoreductase chain 2 n=1 Tax=Calyptraea chinensis TaxID=146264 RepID=C8XQL6_9CAEN|nr:NADH dehydrogenase subunit 2 [Calyptraea chinensis]